MNVRFDLRSCAASHYGGGGGERLTEKSGENTQILGRIKFFVG